jgi:hypothetical protein
MPDIWGRQSESGLSQDTLRDQVHLHLTRCLGEPHVAFSDQDGWAGRSREPGPPVDVMVVPPEGERKFAYVCTFGSSLKKGADPANGRFEFVLAAQQTGEARTDLAALNLAANTVRQFAKLVHMQSIRVQAGQTVQFSRAPKPVIEGSNLVGFAFMAPRLPTDDFRRMRLNTTDGIAFWAPVPINRQELEAGARLGAARLSQGLIRAGVTEMLHADRASAARREHGLGRPLGTWLRDLVKRD